MPRASCVLMAGLPAPGAAQASACVVPTSACLSLLSWPLVGTYPRLFPSWASESFAVCCGRIAASSPCAWLPRCLGQAGVHGDPVACPFFWTEVRGSLRPTWRLGPGSILLALCPHQGFWESDAWGRYKGAPRPSVPPFPGHSSRPPGHWHRGLPSVVECVGGADVEPPLDGEGVRFRVGPVEDLAREHEEPLTPSSHRGFLVGVRQGSSRIPLADGAQG